MTLRYLQQFNLFLQIDILDVELSINFFDLQIVDIGGYDEVIYDIQEEGKLSWKSRRKGNINFEGAYTFCPNRYLPI